MGRPREFDESTVLEEAGRIFWAKGYENTSTRDLTACTGLTPASMYNAFGDKRGLYLRVLEQYLERTLYERIARLGGMASPGRAIAAYFDEIIERSLADPEHRGCMLVNTALEASADNPDLRRFVANETIVIEDFFRRCVTAAQQAGEIPADKPADDLARLLLTLVLGLRVLARVRPDRALLTGLVRPVLVMLNLDDSPAAGAS